MKTHDLDAVTRGLDPRPSPQISEELAGLTYRNQRVADVQKLLAGRNMTVKSYLNSTTELVNGVTTAKEVDPVPADWYVHSVQPDSPGVVMVWVGPQPEK